ncbi:hypothetical protein [Bacillus taeanensis]|uniref:Uncharacterized protein n=1 Tax=Bacillus taeanensis TaxID=273032 RepID=A0A366XTC7_9BACI|nr:hypothetical protein [Bacillus taeanensis]RBW67413.1 hypothetical protein DS031_22355 [Bacillus taeanensis]
MYTFLTAAVVVVIAFALIGTLLIAFNSTDKKYGEKTKSRLTTLSFIYLFSFIVIFGALFLFIYMV